MSYDVLEVCRHVINYSNEQEYGISNLKLQKVHLVLMIKLKHGILVQLYLVHIMNISSMRMEIFQL